jgi:multicomponent Na+:H+ antiporter subunit F
MVETILYLSAGLIGLSFILVLYRFLAGPGEIDRVVALDVFTVSSTALIVIMAHNFGRYIYIDFALVYAILSFIGVMVIAKYLEKGL